MEHRRIQFFIFVVNVCCGAALIGSSEEYQRYPSTLEIDFAKYYERTKGRWAELEKFKLEEMNDICKTASLLPGMNFKGRKLMGRIQVVLPSLQANYKTEISFKTDVLACALGFDKYPYIFYLTKAREPDRLYMLMKKRKNRAELHEKLDMGQLRRDRSAQSQSGGPFRRNHAFLPQNTGPLRGRDTLQTPQTRLRTATFVN